MAPVAARTLGEGALAVTAVSPPLPSGELASARSVAAAVGVAHEVITTAELDRPGTAATTGCGATTARPSCTTGWWTWPRDVGTPSSSPGAKADDLGHWRPGLRAAEEHVIRHPLVEASLGKAAVRELARRLGVPSAEKPCLPVLGAAALPCGTLVYEAVLPGGGRPEAAGPPQPASPPFGELGRVQLVAEELLRHGDDDVRAAVGAAVRAAGYPRGLSIHTRSTATPGWTSVDGTASGYRRGVYGAGKTAPADAVVGARPMRASDPPGSTLATRCLESVRDAAPEAFPDEQVAVDRVARPVAVGSLPLLGGTWRW